jgi:hypothetical protein
MNSEIIPMNPPAPAGSHGHESPENLTIEENGLGRPVAAPIMLDDCPDTEPEETKTSSVNAAFTAQPFFWKNIQLAPFAIDREGDWNRHREILEDVPLKDIMRLPFAVLPDALRVIWFCAHDPREWLSLSGMVQDEEGNWRRLTQKEKALNLEEKIREWSRLHISNSEQALAVGLFYDIYQRAQATRATALPHETHDAQRAKK